MTLVDIHSRDVLSRPLLPLSLLGREDRIIFFLVFRLLEVGASTMRRRNLSSFPFLSHPSFRSCVLLLSRNPGEEGCLRYLYHDSQ